MNHYTHLTRQERSQIGIWLKKGFSRSEIARRLGRSTSTVCRELKRGVNTFGYCCHLSHQKAKSIRLRANQQRAKITPEREASIRDMLMDKFSPEQIATVLARETGISISAVSIYRWIHHYRRGGRFHLKPLLRRKGKPHRKYSSRRKSLEGRPMISQRPESVADRRFYGDWEADLMEGPSSSKRAVLVLIERKSKYTLIRPVEDKKAATVSKTICAALKPFRVRTITYDNGGEFANFASVAADTNSKAFFCNPYHAWEKGLVENTIGLLREYFPKGRRCEFPPDPDAYSSIQNQLNQRPRKTLSFYSPNQFLAKIKTH